MNSSGIHAGASGSKRPTRNESKPKRKGHNKPHYANTGKCTNCGGSRHHTREFCPAKGKTCNYCHKINHIASVCFQTNKDNSTRPKHRAKINEVNNFLPQIKVTPMINILSIRLLMISKRIKLMLNSMLVHKKQK
ncbi:hypothetical protein DPMN_063991 [Dreissena polymorpha]|uniref:Uncharacterized protein n=1 Tax=Dreissena polymorpha TaxID=45954 RepID=A0A9D4CBI2_DREPO|nr:hypothetical protein DPMN_063991 [Dreissena polymorpha]